MKLSIFLMLVFATTISANGIAQEKLTLHVGSLSIGEIFSEIKKQTGYTVVYNNERLSKDEQIRINFKNTKLDELLQTILSGKGMSYELMDEFIILSATPLPQQKEEETITGIVTDKKGENMPGVTVMLKGTAVGTATDIDGKFSLKVPPIEHPKLVFSFVGMKIQEQPLVKGKTSYKIVMEEDAADLEEVVVTGYFERTKTSLTGSAVIVEGEELRKVGSLNLLQAISVFDPAVRTIPNNAYGSDPNHVPEISIRGENGFDLRGTADDSRSNPNAPLYIMDGIEVSATTVYDLDMNRIESFSILKDASATAQYGSRAANGVIVITTVQPKEGEIKVSVNANFNISAPDLQDYNLMNAGEKLEYERLAKEFTGIGGKEEQMRLDVLYNDRLSEVVRGVNTYWLAQPLRTSVNQRYNAFIEGGDGSFRYGVDLKYDNDKGVMEGSGRTKYGINVRLNYQIKNMLYIRNDLSVDDVKGTDSPYGSFTNFAKQNPYERIYDPLTGNMIRKFASNNLQNPLLEGSLPNTSFNNYTDVRDNFSLDWRVNPHFRVNGRIAISKKLTKTEKYRSAQSYEFDTEKDPDKKGSYTISNSNDIGVDGNFTASYNNNFAEKFMVSLGVGSNLTTSSVNGEGFTAVGFLNDNMNNIQYAQQYKEGSKPTGNFDKSKMIGFFGNINLGYDNRYFIDGTFRTDGNSRFGRNSRFAPFWSFGAAWNVNRESFWTGEGTMKLRGSVGSTGSVNFAADQALTRYLYSGTSEYNGIYGAQLLAYGNPSLRWQSTLQYNLGLDMTVWRNIIVLNLDAYIKQTKNLLLPIDVTPSTGFGSYTENMGSMENKGIDARLRFNLINDRQHDLSWNVTLAISHNTNKIKHLSNALESMNQAARDSSATTQPLRIYEAGRSQSALMVVQSMGIDPATGNEIYRKLNGDLTYDYDPKDKIIVGDINPKVQGNFQTNLNWKGINLYMVFGYEFGAVAYNSTLAQKVEGANPKDNADKRVLYDRWKKPGDVAMFRRIDDKTPVYQSTRLVQKNNFVNLQNLSLSYEFSRELLAKTFIERCKLTFSTTDLFRISSMKQERGTSYPFARTFSLGFNITL